MSMPVSPRIAAAGGKIHREPWDVPGVGRIAIVADTRRRRVRLDDVGSPVSRSRPSDEACDAGTAPYDAGQRQLVGGIRPCFVCLSFAAATAAAPSPQRSTAKAASSAALASVARPRPCRHRGRARRSRRRSPPAASATPVDLAAALADGHILPPIDHPDPAHCLVTGTGLTHLGSAEGRDKMHKDLADPAKLTDSMRMFRMGLEGGRPAAGEEGVQPEWFYKGDGSTIVAPGAAACPRPPSRSTPARSRRSPGSTSSRRTARPGASASRSATSSPTTSPSGRTISISPIPSCAPRAIGPELLVGDLPRDIRGTSRILRDGKVVWEKPFLTGEDEHVAHHRQSRRATTSSTRCSASRATSTSTISAPRR